MSFPEFRVRQPFIGLVLAALAGIFIADRWEAPLWPAVGATLSAGIIAWIWPQLSGCLLLTAASFFTLHTLRFHHDPGRAVARLLEAQPRIIHATGIVLDEPQLPQEYERDVSCFFPLEIESSDLPLRSRGIRMNVSWSGPIPSYGDRVSLTGGCRNLAPLRNPGQFDFARYLQRSGIWSEIEVRFAADVAITAAHQGWRVQEFAFLARHWIQRQLELDLTGSPEISALIQSMVLGLRGDTPDDARELFQRTGTLHLFAVSGLNVAMLAGIATLLLRSLRISGAAMIAITLPLLIFYAIVTGLQASCVRATIMGVFILVAPLLDRRALATNSICAAAFLILAFDTNQLFAPGFQFSFVLVLAIIFLARRIERRFLPLVAPDAFLPRALWNRWQSWRQAGWQLVASTLGVTFAAWIGSLVFTAGYFHLFSLAAIVANLLAVPIAFFVLTLGVGTLLTAWWWKAAAIAFNNANWFCAQALLAVVRFFAQLPGGHVYVELPSWRPAAVCELSALDVRDGAAMHLRTAGCDWLFDCGSAPAYERTVLPYLRTRGVNTLDGLLLTHGDSHHVGGAQPLMADFRPRSICDSLLADRSGTRREFQRELAAHRLGKSILARGDRLHLGPQVVARVLFPPAKISRSLADDRALVVQVCASGRRLLLMADSGFSTEQWLLTNEPDLRSDVIFKGQHSRDLSATPEFLARVQPLAVVCSALDFHHDASELDEWEAATLARGIAVFRQDRTGAVRLTIARDGTLELRAFVGGQIFRNLAR